MGTTSRAALRFPTDSDAADGPQALDFLAADVDAELYRAFTCTNATRPTLGAGDVSFLADVTDLGTLEKWTGSAWVVIGGSSGGGGGVAVEGQWRASSAQSIPNGADTVVAFGTQETESAIVSRTSEGTGHYFTLAETGCYAVNFTGRYADGPAGRRFFELRNRGQTVRYPGASCGSYINDDPSTWSFSTVLRFPADHQLVVIAAQTTGAGLALEHTGSTITNGFVRLNITKLTA